MSPWVFILFAVVFTGAMVGNIDFVLKGGTDLMPWLPAWLGWVGAAIDAYLVVLCIRGAKRAFARRKKSS